MKFIASDLDGTILLKGEKKLNVAAAAAVQRIMDSDAEFCIASGRNYGELIRILGKFEGKLSFIANDGGLAIYDGKTVFENPVSKEELMLFEKEKKVVAHGKYVSFVKSEHKRFVREIKEQYFGHVLEVKSLDIINEPIYKITSYDSDGSIADLKCIYKDNSMREYVKNGVDKGEALLKILQKIGIKESDTAVIGDNVNDIEMFKLTDKSFILATAPPKVKQYGEYIVNSFSEAIENLFKECRI